MSSYRFLYKIALLSQEKSVLTAFISIFLKCFLFLNIDNVSLIALAKEETEFFSKRNPFLPFEIES